MKTPTLFWLYTGFTFHNMMSMAFLVWIPAFLMRAQGISEDKAGIMIGIIALSAMVGAPLGGWLADFWQKSNKRGRMLVPALSDFLAAILIIAATLLNLEGVGFAIAIGYGIIHVCSLPALQAVTQDVVPPWMKGTSWSLAQFFMYIPLGCLAPTAVGIISDAVGGGVYGLKVALIIMSLGGFVGALCFFISSKHYFSDSEKVKQHVLEME